MQVLEKNSQNIFNGFYDEFLTIVDGEAPLKKSKKRGPPKKEVESQKPQTAPVPVTEEEAEEELGEIGEEPLAQEDEAPQYFTYGDNDEAKEPLDDTKRGLMPF